MTGFSVFSADRSHVEILEVEEGRQNCFAALLVFLLQSLRVAVQTAATVASTDTTGGVKARGAMGGSPAHPQPSPAPRRFNAYRGGGREEHAGDPLAVNPNTLTFTVIMWGDNEPPYLSYHSCVYTRKHPFTHTPCTSSHPSIMTMQLVVVPPLHPHHHLLELVVVEQ